MTDYERGFLEALQAVCWLITSLHRRHLDNAENKALSEDDREAAFNCACVLGQFSCSVQQVGSDVRRGDLTPQKIVSGNPDLKRYWWAAGTEDLS
jgi:hypothetical protein